MINPRPQQLVQCVGVRVELHHADRPLARQGAQNGQRDRVVSTDGDRGRTDRDDPAEYCSIRSMLPDGLSGLTGASPISATLQSTNGAMPLVG
jgi:hypothetical protein